MCRHVRESGKRVALLPQESPVNTFTRSFKLPPRFPISTSMLSSLLINAAPSLLSCYLIVGTMEVHRKEMATDHQEKPTLAASLSVSLSLSVGSGSAASADDATSDIHNHDRSPPVELSVETADSDDDSTEDFEFAFVVRDPEAFPADEIFYDGRILPSYPLFNRDLLLLPRPEATGVAADATSDMADRIPLRGLLLDEKEEASAASSPVVPEAAGEYCAWAPDRRKKSASTGSSLRWRLRDLMIGRSQSDGKEKIVFLQAAAPAKEKKADATAAKATATPGKVEKKAVRMTEMDVVTAHRLFYGKGAREKAAKGPRRSYLPYRQQLFGLFAPANTLHRTNHPF